VRIAYAALIQEVQLVHQRLVRPFDDEPEGLRSFVEAVDAAISTLGRIDAINKRLSELGPQNDDSDPAAR
jgi:hypothetical protein